MIKLFSYGTLQDTNVQQATFNRLVTHYPATIYGFKLSSLEISNPDVIEKSSQTIHPAAIKTDDPNDQINGVILEITEAEMRASDQYESADYRRIEAITLNDERVWLYIKK